MKHGACVLDTSQSLSVLNYHGWSVRHSSGLKVITFSRPLLDWCMLRRISSHPRIRVIENCRVAGLEAEGDYISGVRCRSSSGHGADLVVDATGRFSRTPEWLSEIGVGETAEAEVDPRLGYATRFFERSSRRESEVKALLLLGKPPDLTRGGVLLPVEGGRWVATLVGMSGDYPPTDSDGFLEFARTLRSTDLHEIINNETALSPISGFRATKNRLRYYNKRSQWPRRFVVLGDAACALNPVYAQGMTVAALSIRALDRVIRRAGHNSVGLQFRRVLSKIHRIPWFFATAEDLRWPCTEGYRVGHIGRLVHRYLDGIIAAATDIPEVDETLARVVHMIDSPTRLLSPHVAAPALSRAVRRNKV